MTQFKDTVKIIKYHPGFTPPTVKMMDRHEACQLAKNQKYTPARTYNNDAQGFREVWFEKPNCKTEICIWFYYEA